MRRGPGIQTEFAGSGAAAWIPGSPRWPLASLAALRAAPRNDELMAAQFALVQTWLLQMKPASAQPSSFSEVGLTSVSVPS